MVHSYLVDVLALKLLEQRLDAGLFSLDTDRAENFLDVAGGRRGVAGQAEEEVRREVLHFVGVCRCLSVTVFSACLRCRQ